MAGPAPKYGLEFHEDALKEWKKLDGSVREPLKKALEKRLTNPHVPASRLHGKLANCYKIKLAAVGYRLVYAVEDDRLVVLVLAVDRRDKGAVYEIASGRVKIQIEVKEAKPKAPKKRR